jgi:hypothetical protein
MKEVNSSSALEMGVNETGLYLIPMILFRPIHKPFLIPWGEIHAEPFKRFLFKGHRLTFKSFPDITLEMYNRTFEKIIEHLKGQTDFQQPPA